jgi:hypothetical protein
MGAYLLTAYYSQEEEYMSSESKRVPIGVWIFWAILGLLILGFLASRYTHFGNALNFAVSFISVLASAGAAVAAYLAVKDFGTNGRKNAVIGSHTFLSSEARLERLRTTKLSIVIAVSFERTVETLEQIRRRI